MQFDRKTPKSEVTRRLALAKATRNHAKRHGTGRRKAHLSAAKKRRIEFKNAQIAKRVAKAKQAARAYWAGEVDELQL